MNSVDVLLINPPQNAELRTLLELHGPPMASMYLAGYARAKGYTPRILDLDMENMTKEQVTSYVSSLSPRVVGMTAFTSTVKVAYSLLAEIKRALPNALTVIGGPHVTFMPDEALSQEGIDVAAMGEGEATLDDLIGTYESGKPLEGVRGIAYKKDGSMKLNQPRPMIENLDEVPFPARDLVSYERYRWNGVLEAPIMTTRGCTFRCQYCSSSEMMGRRYRTRSVQNVIDEIRDVQEKYHVRDIEFIDDTFTLNMKRASEVMKSIVKEKLDVKLALSSRVNTINEDLMQDLKKGGTANMYFGVESGSQRVLDLMQKGIKLEQAASAVNLAKKYNVGVLCSYIVGFPGETPEEMDQTIKFSVKLNSDYAQFSILTPFPGTPIYYDLDKKGLIATKDWTLYTVLHPLIKYEAFGYSANLVAKKLTDAYRVFYLRLGYLAKRRYMLPLIMKTIRRSLRLARMMAKGYGKAVQAY
ncbi:MAG: B12-binding domain-containing radical SAM protein [Nitrososphaerota archaeon]|nr:B12-binding domain-containing radical SAM protein [Nitrososphaerota archaeon]MDG6930848.1 B12-binding domain-containing radical SAM protein [Nitrososphaerota archaeon]